MNDFLSEPIRLPLRLRVVPTLSVLLASLVTALPVITSAPLLPPFGFILFVSWRLMRSTIWPIWIGIPLGLFDDLVSGQPVGSAVALWSIVMLALDAVDRRLVWRDHWVDWLLGGVALAFVLVGGAILARVGGPLDIMRLVGPQFLWSLFLLPLCMLLVARLDTWRLKR